MQIRTITNQRIRLLALIGSGRYTPVQESFVRLCAAYDRQQFDINMIYACHGPLTSRLAAERIEQTIIGMWDHLDWYSLSSLVAFIKHKKIEILHTHKPRATTIGALAARLCGIPCVATLYDLPDEAEQSLSDLCSITWVASSETIRTQSPLPITATILPAAPPSVKPGTRASFGLQEHGPLIAYLGRLDDAGGADRFVDIVIQLAPQWPQVQWLLLGNGPLEFELRRKTEAYNVIFLTPSPDLLPLLSLAIQPARNALVVPAAIDLMAAGVPVIATRTGFYAELLEERGVLIDDGELCAFADAIAAYLVDPSIFQPLAGAARCYIEQNWMPEACAERYARLYTQILGRAEP